MNLSTILSALQRRFRTPEPEHRGRWLAVPLVLALLGTGAAFVRNLDDEPKLALGTRVLGYLAGAGSGAKPAAPASGTQVGAAAPLPRH